MSTHYDIYFDKENISDLKLFLTEHPDKKIFSDHFTKYSVDLLRNYKDLTKSERILETDFNWGTIKPGELVLFNQKHIDELIMQKYTYPNFSTLRSGLFNKIDEFGDFVIYQKMKY